MSLDSVKEFIQENAPEIEIIISEKSTATVIEAAEALGVTPGQIAKTLALKAGEERLLLVVAGDMKLDNKKFKEAFKNKPQMLPLEETVELTGHPIGGVNPFGLKSEVPVYCDISLRVYGEIFPAAGSVNSALRITPNRLLELTKSSWVDVCK